MSKLAEVTAKAVTVNGAKQQAEYYKDSVTTAMQELRTPIDKLEMIVDKKLWPVPSYGDLIFEV